MENTVIKASLGTGYRTPTPYELYSIYGNTNLKPEKSLTYDIGGEFSSERNLFNLYLGLFETKVEDIITYSSLKYRQSSANLKSNGLEARLKSILSDSLSIGVNYTKTNSKEGDGDSITLVPKDKITFNLNLKPLERLILILLIYFKIKPKIQNLMNYLFINL